MMKRKTIFLMWVGLLAMLTSYSQTKVLPKFWERIEVGTNLIPMADSLTLQPSNLMVKYYYGKNHDNAFRVNLILSDVQLHPAGCVNFDATHLLQLGHVWYYNLREHIKLYQAVDLEYSNDACGAYIKNSKDDIFNRNEILACYTLGIRYEFLKNFSLEFETRAKAGLTVYYQNHQTINGVEVFKPAYSYFYDFYYRPINSLTINYKFQL